MSQVSGTLSPKNGLAAAEDSKIQNGDMIKEQSHEPQQNNSQQDPGADGSPVFKKDEDFNGSRSRSRSPMKDGSRSPSPRNRSMSRSLSRSRSRSFRSLSKSPLTRSPRSRSRSYTKSRTRSPSPRSKSRSYSRSPRPRSRSGRSRRSRSYDRYDRRDRYDRGDRGRGDFRDRRGRYDSYSGGRGGGYGRGRYDRFGGGGRGGGRYGDRRPYRSPPPPVHLDRTPPPAYLHLYVAGLNFSVDEKELEYKFERYGKILEARLVRNRHSNDSKGYGFVVLDTPEACKEAIRALNGINWHGRRLIVERAKNIK